MGLLRKKVEAQKVRDYRRTFSAEGGAVTISLHERECPATYDRFEGTAAEARAMGAALFDAAGEASRLEGAVASIYAK